MTTEVLALSLVAGVQATFGQGSVWYVKTAAGPLTITAETAGSGAKVRKFSNVLAGFKFSSKNGEPWTYLRVLSATTQNIELVIGDDDVEVAGAVSIVGTVPVIGTITPNPSATITASVADTVIATASAFSIAANSGRRRLTIGALVSNTGTVRIQSTGAGAAKGLELQAGNFVQFETTAALDVRNDSGASQTVYFVEES